MMSTKISGKRANSTVKNPTYKAPALEKGLDIIELLADQPEGMTQAQIATALNRSVSEIFRMIDGLLRRRYIALSPTGDRYILTLKMFELSHRHAPMRRLIHNALPHMRDVAHRLNQACHIAVFHEGRIMVVAQVDNPESIGLVVRMGAQLDLLRTSSGLVMLAFAGKDERERMLSEYKLFVGNVVDRKALNAQLEVIRQLGFHEAESQLVDGVRNLSFPVFSFSGDVIATIAVPYLRRINGGYPDLDVARGVLNDVATKISTAMGATVAR